jgi:hypothetical protein
MLMIAGRIAEVVYAEYSFFKNQLYINFMNLKQQSKLKMYLTLRIYLLSNPAITATLPNFQEFMNALDAAILQIQNNSEEQHFDTKGITNNKQQYRDSVVTLTVDNSAKMQAYAKYTGNAVLMAETKFTKTGIARIPVLELVDIVNGLYNRIQTHLPNLTPYSLTAETQTRYRTAIDDYIETIPHTRQSQMKSRENSLLETQGFVDGDEAIKNIDIVVEIVRLVEPVFYSGYKNARKIVEQGTNSLQVQGIVTEAVSTLPIPFAVLTFRLAGQTEVIVEKETAAKGGFMIKSLAEGIYDVTVSKMGFKTQTVTVTVRWDQLCNVTVAMESI